MTATAEAATEPRPIRLWRLPGVYAPQADTGLLAEALSREIVTPGTEVLDVGTGTGALAVLAAGMGARVEATDISWRAVLTARLNAARAGHRVAVRRRHLARLPDGRTYDLVLGNPPYVPGPPPRGAARTRRSARAWDGGAQGRDLVDLMCVRAAALLRPHGVLLMVHSGLCGPERTLDTLRQCGLSGQVAARTRIPYGPVLRSRLQWLRAQGLVGADERAEELMEELVVIRAQRP